jgi:hypothetical protein
MISMMELIKLRDTSLGARVVLRKGETFPAQSNGSSVPITGKDRVSVKKKKESKI